MIINVFQLVLTVMLLSIIVYIYTVVAFNFFRKFYVKEEDGEVDYKCHDMLTVSQPLSESSLPLSQVILPLSKFSLPHCGLHCIFEKDKQTKHRRQNINQFMIC